MAISDRTRKLLWGKSGNRCANCFRVLSVDESELDDPSIVGEECHIVSGRRGPRADTAFPADAIDEYPNLILLCRVDHKVVDDQERTFPADVLHAMKDAHERKVERALALAPTLADEIADPHHILAAYTTAFRTFYTADAPGILATPILRDGIAATTTDVLEAPLAGHLVVTGVSGSGKSHLLRHLADRALAAGAVPVFARASVFAGDLEQVLDRAVAPLENTSYDTVRRAAAQTGSRACVIVDALNECPPALRDRLRDALAALARKPGHLLWVSSTDELQLASIAPRVVRFAALTAADRGALFTFYAPRAVVDASALDAFTTPLEIAIAGETVNAHEGRISWYELFRRFTMRRLRSAGRPAHAEALLERVAGEMSRTYRATISRRTLVRLAEEASSAHTPGDIEDILRSGLLREFGSDITFMHEQVQVFFEALSFLGGRGVATVTQIASPERRRLAPYVLAGLEDAEEIRACATALADARLLAGMLAGRSGARAKAVATREAKALLEQSERAIRTATVSIQRETQPYTLRAARASFDGLPMLGRYEIALLAAIGETTRDGAFLEEVIALLNATEECVYGAAEPRDRPSLLAALFVLQYDGHRCAASVVVQAATVGIVHVTPNVKRLLPLLEPLAEATDAGLYFACSLLKHADMTAADAIRLFREAWRRNIYHLSLDALDVLHFRRSSVTDEEAADIRLVLEGCITKNLMLNTAVTDVMLAYDMIESPVSDERAAEEFAEMLAMPDGTDAFELAYGLVGNCFEDIFQGAYWQAMRALSADDEVTLLTRAALGADTSGFHVEWIFQRLLTLGSPRALPAYLRWATIDPSASSFPQSATMAFFVSVAACARLGHAFTTFPALSKNHDAWRVLAEIVYVVNGGAITVPLVELWRRLIDDYASEAVEPLKEIAQERRDFDGCGINLDLAARFPRELTRLLEEVVRRGLVVTSIRDHGAWLAEEAPIFIFSKLALIGSLETVPVVQPFVEHPKWGVEAVNAIRAIQTR